MRSDLVQHGPYMPYGFLSNTAAARFSYLLSIASGRMPALPLRIAQRGAERKIQRCNVAVQLYAFVISRIPAQQNGQAIQQNTRHFFINIHIFHRLIIQARFMHYPD
jgi:hypothetical protein